MIKRRQFIQSAFLASVGINASGPMAAKRSPFGPLKADPRKILDLPNGFNYTVISEQGRMMKDGLLTPAQAEIGRAHV